MSEKKNILVIGSDLSVRDNLQKFFPNTQIQSALNIETINKVVKSSEQLAAVILHLDNSSQWIHMEFLQSCYPSVAKFAIVGYRDNSFDDREPVSLALEYGAAYVFIAPADYVQIARSLARTIPELPSPVFDLQEVRREILKEVMSELNRLETENEDLASSVKVPDTHPTFADVDILNTVHHSLLNMQFNRLNQ